MLTEEEKNAGLVGRIDQVNIEDQMKSAYIDYSMSVIVSRALPDVRDGLKPVHRRILYDMNSELNLYSDKPTRKSARIVGDVLGKFHPHGDSSVYDAMCRLAQSWSMRYPLVDGQGNFGSMDGDSPAAMRYTEARMEKITDEVMADIDKDTIDWTLNFDETTKEPTVLPTKIPLLLVNGASGIAVGMATNMAPHNLGEVIDACAAYIDNRECSVEDLMHFVKAPDFPTGGIIYGYEGVKNAMLTGRGRVVIRARHEFETLPNGRELIVLTEIPYMVNKSDMIKHIADLVKDGKIEGISDINDESDRHGIRVVIHLKQDANANVVLNSLFKYSEVQSSFSVNNIALVNGRPKLLNLKDLISNFVNFRHDVVIRRSQFELRKAQERLHIVEGLLIAQDNIDEVVSIIRHSATIEIAKQTLSAKFGLTDVQTSAIVEMRLRSLVGLEREKLLQEKNDLVEKINYLEQVLTNEDMQFSIVKDELLEIKEKYADERRSEIKYAAEEFSAEDFYADDDMVITISHLGYIKRTPLNEYREQNRGGKGMKGSTTRDEDFIEHIYVATMHNTMMLFTELGYCHWLKVYDIPEGARASKGRAIQNVIQIEPGDKVKAYINCKRLSDQEYTDSNYIVMCTKNGTIKKTLLTAYSNVRQKGIRAINIAPGDELINACLTSGNAQMMMATKDGKAIRFNEQLVRPMGRVSTGVRGINIEEDNAVIGMLCIEPDSGLDVLVLSANGYGKRTDIDEYREQNRGGKGVKTINITDKTGVLSCFEAVNDSMDLMIITTAGLTIRTGMDGIKKSGRNTQGVKIITLKEGDSIASIALAPKSENEDETMEANTQEEATKSENENTTIEQINEQ
ncbi:MAG: DNA gyrase subunit A [Alistipes sp.]|nr:DNA gyrase subunit A [Candidatus Alistipes equi]